MKLGERIKERRKELGMSQKELGEKLEITQKQISKYERDESIPTIRQIEKIAEALKVPIGYFIYKTEAAEIHSGKVINNYTSPYKKESIANKPPENKFSKQQQELLNIMQPMTEQEQNQLLGAVKMYLSTQISRN